MEYRVTLLYKDRQCLLAKAEPESAAWQVLISSSPDFDVVGGTEVEPYEVSILCDEDSAGELIELARVYCPTAVSAIEKGIHKGGLQSC